MVKIPERAGQLILDEVAVRVRPLLAADKFVKFCKDRSLDVSSERLHRLEQFGLLRPLVRVKKLEEGHVLHLDGKPTTYETWRDYIVESSSPNADYTLPPEEDPGSMAFFSVYQIWELEEILRAVNLNIPLETLLEENLGAKFLSQRLEWWHKTGNESVQRLRRDSRRRAISILGQYLSNRYIPSATTDQRTINTGGSTQFGPGGWISFDSDSWDWDDYRRRYDPQAAVRAFGLDDIVLERAHAAVAASVHSLDP